MKSHMNPHYLWAGVVMLIASVLIVAIFSVDLLVAPLFILGLISILVSFADDKSHA